MTSFKWPPTSAGSGDVTGPSSGTDNAVARFDGATGKQLQDSLVTISDTGNIVLPALATVDGRDVSVDGAALDAFIASKAQPSGLASLDAGGLVPSAQIPPIAITDTFVVASQAAQEALTAQVGDVAVRTDLNKSYILRVSPATVFANWQEMLTPTDTVLSVNGQTGVVSLTAADVGLGNVDNTSDAAKNAAVATVTNKSMSGSSNTFTNIPLTTAVTGALPIANGGTGQTSANTARNALLPVQTGNATKSLVTDGTNVTWEDRISSVLPDGQILVGDASATAVARTPTGDVTISNLGVTAIAPGVIVNADINASAGIVYSKLNLVGGIVNADINAAAAIAGTKVDAATTTVRGTVTGGTVPGQPSSTTIAAGFIGQTQQTTTARASAFGMGTGTTYNISTGILLTPGIYLLMGAVCATSSATSYRADYAISTTSATNPSSTLVGDSYFFDSKTVNLGTQDYTSVIPPIYVTVTSNTTYYLVMTPTFTGGNANGYGSFRAVRVA